MAAPRISTLVTTNTSTPFHHSPSSPLFSTSHFPRTPHPFPTITIFTPHKLHRSTNFSTSVSGIWDAITGGADSSRQALIAIRRGMVLFRQGDVARSVVEFDNATKLDPRQKAYLWQRGLSLYYLDSKQEALIEEAVSSGRGWASTTYNCLCGFLGSLLGVTMMNFGRFEEGAEQFRIDVAQNPNDIEESIWCFLCEAQLYGAAEARKKIPEVGRDPRPVMREAYNMFKDGSDPEKLVDAFSKGRESEYFYASLYAGLYYESQNEADNAKVHIVASYKSPYGQRSDDYMASLAKVHCLCRNWEL